MSYTLKNAKGKTILHVVAKTSRGFNRKQHQLIRECIACVQIDPLWDGPSKQVLAKFQATH